MGRLLPLLAVVTLLLSVVSALSLGELYDSNYERRRRWRRTRLAPRAGTSPTPNGRQASQIVTSQYSECPLVAGYVFNQLTVNDPSTSHYIECGYNSVTGNVTNNIQCFYLTNGNLYSGNTPCNGAPNSLMRQSSTICYTTCPASPVAGYVLTLDDPGSAEIISGGGSTTLYCLYGPTSNSAYPNVVQCKYDATAGTRLSSSDSRCAATSPQSTLDTCLQTFSDNGTR